MDERQYDFKSHSLKNAPKPRAKLLWLGRPVLPEFRTLGSDCWIDTCLPLAMNITCRFSGGCSWW